MVTASGMIMPHITEEQLECLAQNVYHESRTQSQSGQFAVTHVVLNRVKSSDYPNEICAVVKQGKLARNGKPLRDRCQFSWYCDGKSDEPKNLPIWERSKRAALDAYMLHTIGFDASEGSLFYHAIYVSPHWKSSVDRAVRIDDHIFYRKKGKKPIYISMK